MHSSRTVVGQIDFKVAVGSFLDGIENPVDELDKTAQVRPKVGQEGAVINARDDLASDGIALTFQADRVSDPTIVFFLETVTEALAGRHQQLDMLLDLADDDLLFVFLREKFFKQVVHPSRA